MLNQESIKMVKKHSGKTSGIQEEKKKNSYRLSNFSLRSVKTRNASHNKILRCSLPALEKVILIDSKA